MFTGVLVCHFLFVHPRWPHVCTFHGVAPRLSYQEMLAQKATWAIEGSWEGTNWHLPSSSCCHPHHIQVSADQGPVINRGHTPLKDLLGLATSSHLKKWSIPHEENKVKNSTDLPFTTNKKYHSVTGELFMTAMGKVKQQIHWVIRQWIFWRRREQVFHSVYDGARMR